MMQGSYDVTRESSAKHLAARAKFEKSMKDALVAKPEIINHLLPDFPPLCKRLTPGPGYLEALSSDKIDVITTSITRVDEHGVHTSDGKHRRVDAIICATGFDSSPASLFPIIGRNGVNLRERHLHSPESYLGLCTDGFPNFFQSLGPNSFQGSGNL
jgi:cation diffusion facilitator CzcD-associated flavoprotein CzcO